MRRIVNASFTGCTLKIDGYLELVIPMGAEVALDGDKIVISNTTSSPTFVRPDWLKPLASIGE